MSLTRILQKVYTRTKRGHMFGYQVPDPDEAMLNGNGTASQRISEVARVAERSTPRTPPEKFPQKHVYESGVPGIITVM
jgi:hypothetical protein